MWASDDPVRLLFLRSKVEVLKIKKESGKQTKSVEKVQDTLFHASKTLATKSSQKNFLTDKMLTDALLLQFDKEMNI